MRRREAMLLTHFDEPVPTDGEPDSAKCAGVVMQEIQSRHREQAAAGSMDTADTVEARRYVT